MGRKAKNRVKSVRFYRAEGKIGERERDMLRYDFAFACEDAPGDEDEGPVIAFPVMADGSGSKEPTLRRWQSFGLKLRPIKAGAHSVPEGERIVCPHGDECWNRVDHQYWVDGLLTGDGPHEWVTYRHPRKSEGGPYDYSKLVPVSLDEFLKLDRDAPLGDADPVAS